MSELVKACGTLSDKSQNSLIYCASGLALIGLAGCIYLANKVIEKCNTFSYDSKTKKFQATVA